MTLYNELREVLFGDAKALPDDKKDAQRYRLLRSLANEDFGAALAEEAFSRGVPPALIETGDIDAIIDYMILKPQPEITALLAWRTTEGNARESASDAGSEIKPDGVSDQGSVRNATDRKTAMTDDQIKYMVDRFLGWRLPEHFSPDCGISFVPEFNVEWNAKHGKPPQRHEPIGTNLFDANQAEAMIRYLVEGMPIRGLPDQKD